MHSKSILEVNRYADNRNIYIGSYDLLIFIILKVAGSSIWQVSANLLGHTVQHEEEIRQFRLPSVSTVDISKHSVTHKAAFVRNPWDRLLSCYLQKKNKNSTNFFNRNSLSINMTFEEFATAVCNIPDHLADRHFRSQFTYVTDQNAVLIPSFIGEFSAIRKDIIKLLQIVNAPQQKIPHRNMTNHSNYTDYYSPTLKTLVGERYNVDNKLFGYEFGAPVRKDFYTYWKRDLPQDIQGKILKYKANKLLHCLRVSKENFILKPKSLRQRIRILLKGR